MFIIYLQSNEQCFIFAAHNNKHTTSTNIAQQTNTQEYNNKINKMKELQNINKAERLKPVKKTLENMKKGAVIEAPRYQRSSIRTTMDRIKDESFKRYSIKTVNSLIQIKRIN